MIPVLLIIFLSTLFYMAIANRIMTLLKILALQGLVLFAVAFLQLNEIDTLNLVLILLETVVFKALLSPFFLAYLVKRNRITREAEPYLSNFFSLILTTLIIFITILLSDFVVESRLHKVFFVVALSSLLVGLYFIASRRKIITHIIGYLVIENGVFVLSLAVGNEMPMLVNLGIMLDIFASVLILGIFLNKIGDVFHDVDVDRLSSLKDY